ncbi:MAG: acetate--CoA ligase family protein, partial [Alphaproteobacteria bacterium]
HSGTIVGTLLSRGQARGMGFSKLVAIGNEADLSVGEVGNMLVDDHETKVILLFLETMRDPAGLAAMARRAYEAGKPVIAYKLGRSDAGRRLVISHSGAIAGDDAAAAAYFRHHGILRVDMMETILEIPALVAGRRPQPGNAGRVAVLTTTGGGAALVVDRLGALGIDLITPPAALVSQLADAGIKLGGGPVIDVTMAGARRDIYQPALEALLAAPECDAVIAVVGSSAQFHPHIAVEPIVAASRTSDKPLAAFLVPEAPESLALLAEAGIAAFRTPEACADAMRASLDWSPPAATPIGNAPAGAAEALRAATTPVLDEMASRGVLKALGIPYAPAHVLGDGETVSRIGYPVAAKVLSADIAHKTEAGGVALGIADDEALEAAARDIRLRVSEAHPNAHLTGILVQRMECGLAEVLIGYRHGAESGPLIMVSPGGTLAEIYRDAAVRLAPVDIAIAREMIEEVQGLGPIRGYRGLPKGDLDALAAAIAALSDLARLGEDTPLVLEAEINPLIVRAEGEGVVAVDGLVVIDK